MSRPRLIFLRLGARPESTAASSGPPPESSSAESPLRQLRSWQPRVPTELSDSPFFVGESRGGHGDFPTAFREHLDSLVPTVETVGEQGAYLDLSGCDRLYPDSGEFLAQLSRVAEELGVGPLSAGEAGSRLVARLAAVVAPAGRWWAVENPTAFLGPFPLSCLADEYPAMVKALERMGLRRLGELAAMPADLLRQALGDEALLLWRESRGEGRRHLSARGSTERVRERYVFERPQSDPAMVNSVLLILADRLAVGLRGLGLASARLELQLRFHGGGRVQRRRSVEPPSASLSTLRGVVGAMFEGVEARRTAVVSCELRAERLRETPAESLTLDFVQARHDLAPFITEVRERFGENALRWSPELWMDQPKRSP